ncbi:GNAT family N-acetyltransferase [Paraburkholderia sp. J94]|uniref:GNAT family N-acetyltransferase n=1 Tax=Paraburkholderia sp. J94 TaxID=2805441 RepID=UPI002AB114E7|nr:GNAT family N-acetyltransferase [Paraburkholderia sp. J94]
MNLPHDAAAERAAFAKALRVRAAEVDDADAMAALMNLPGVRPGTLSHGYRTGEAVRAWLASQKADSMTVVAEYEGQIVGQSELRAHDGRRAHCGSLGISVHDAYHGRGVGSLLLAALLDAADNAFGLRRIELQVFADNAPALALYRKFGFEVEACARADAIRDGALHDVLHMARLVDAPAFAPPADTTGENANASADTTPDSPTAL